MSGLEEPSLPVELNDDGSIKLTAVSEFATSLLPGAIMVSLRYASTAEALFEGGDATLQFAMSLPEIQGLIEMLTNAETVLRNAEQPPTATH